MNTNSNSPFDESTTPPRIAFIQANWHKDIVEQSRISFAGVLTQAGIPESYIDVIDVPGSLEIPLQCQRLANSGNYQIIVAAGLIVDGGIYRHDFVGATVLDGMMRVQLDCNIPILSVVLTPHHFNDQPEHQKFFFEHFSVKGKEAANTCLQVLSLENIQREKWAQQAD